MSMDLVGIVPILHIPTLMLPEYVSLNKALNLSISSSVTWSEYYALLELLMKKS